MQKNQFKDLNDKVWTINITVREYMALKTECDVDLGNVFTSDDSWLNQLLSGDDMTAFLVMLGIMTDKEREREGISMEQFYESMGGDVLHSATEALVEGVVNFTHPSRRDALRAVVKSTEEGLMMMSKAIVKETELATEKMRMELPKAIEKAMKTD